MHNTRTNLHQSSGENSLIAVIALTEMVSKPSNQLLSHFRFMPYLRDRTDGNASDVTGIFSIFVSCAKNHQSTGRYSAEISGKYLPYHTEICGQRWNYIVSEITVEERYAKSLTKLINEQDMY